MEVMPIYQVNLLIHNILIGMICLDEIKFYSATMLLAIAAATLLNVLGIYILLQKNREKRVMLVGEPIPSTTIELQINTFDDEVSAGPVS